MKVLSRLLFICSTFYFVSCSKSVIAVDNSPDTLQVIITGTDTTHLPGNDTSTANHDNDHMLLGNPDNADSNVLSVSKYLMIKSYYDVSFSNSKNIPNWVSWHLQSSDLGAINRQDDFRADYTLPSSWYHVMENSYQNSGFDRGHNCPSADRTSTVASNSATFLMTNMIPQAPYNNQHTWANLESYTRNMVVQGNEVFVIAGSYGIGGEGSQGAANTIANGMVTVPSNVWKVIVVLPQGNNDLRRVSSITQVIAVNTPNINSVSSNWQQYRTSIDAIETATGYNFLSNVSDSIQAVIEAKVN